MRDVAEFANFIVNHVCRVSGSQLWVEVFSTDRAVNFHKSFDCIILYVKNINKIDTWSVVLVLFTC